MEASKIPIQRHIKLKAQATPYDPTYHDYLDRRLTKRMDDRKKSKRPHWWLCWWNLLKPNDIGQKVRAMDNGLIKA